MAFDDCSNSTKYSAMHGDQYYHRSTFLQLNTIRFLLCCPLHLIPLDILGSRRNNYNSVFAFLFEDIPPIICGNSPHKVLD